MTYGVYCIRDCVSELFLQPWIERNDNTAKRVFSVSLRAQKDVKPSDFELWYLGDFCSDSGEILGVDKVLICTGSKEMCDDV